MEAAAFVQRVDIVGLRREHGLVGGKRLVFARQALERSGTAFQRVEIIRMIGQRLSKQASASSWRLSAPRMRP